MAATVTAVPIEDLLPHVSKLKPVLTGSEQDNSGIGRHDSASSSCTDNDAPAVLHACVPWVGASADRCRFVGKSSTPASRVAANAAAAGRQPATMLRDNWADPNFSIALQFMFQCIHDRVAAEAAQLPVGRRSSLETKPAQGNARSHVGPCPSLAPLQSSPAAAGLAAAATGKHAESVEMPSAVHAVRHLTVAPHKPRFQPAPHGAALGLLDTRCCDTEWDCYRGASVYGDYAKRCTDAYVPPAPPSRWWHRLLPGRRGAAARRAAAAAHQLTAETCMDTFRWLAALERAYEEGWFATTCLSTTAPLVSAPDS